MGVGRGGMYSDDGGGRYVENNTNAPRRSTSVVSHDDNDNTVLATLQSIT